ncbi:DUF502 domain-containing protein [Gottschalkiaceae bacterium SANA]|nr:DUF502 domain-containing protein [Gottschalkiaceae bacterium SANA]
MKKIFISGLFSLLPIGLTIFLIQIVFHWVDSFGSPVVRQFTDLKIPGLGFLLTLGLIFFAGLFMQVFLGKKLLSLLDSLIERIPLINHLYHGIKGVTDSFSQVPDREFSMVVLVKYPTPEFESIGLITNESVFIGGNKKVAVFIPTTPNPTNGFLVLAKEEDLTPLDIPVDEALKSVISMGSVWPKKYQIDSNSIESNGRPVTQNKDNPIGSDQP